MPDHPPDESTDAATVDAVNSEPDRVDVHEIAARLGVGVKTIHVWRSTRRIMPEPDYDTAEGHLWDWETILRWAGDTGRLRSVERIDEYRKLTGHDPIAPRKGGPVSAEVKERLRAG